METIFQICSLAFISALFCVLLRGYNASGAMLLSLAAAVVIFLVGLRFMKPIITILDQLRSLSQVDPTITKPMMKIVGIGIISQLADEICCDAGEKALGKAVQISSTIFALYSALPLLNSILNTLQKALGVIS